MNGETTINFNKVIDHVGRTVSLHTPDGWSSPPFRAVIQPLRYKNKMYLEGERTAIGHNHQGYYVYIGPSSHDITALGPNATVKSAGEEYVIDRAEKCWRGDSVTHIWAIIRSMEGIV